MMNKQIEKNAIDGAVARDYLIRRGEIHFRPLSGGYGIRPYGLWNMTEHRLSDPTDRRAAH